MKRETKKIPIVVALIGICIFAPIVGAETATEWNNNGVMFTMTSKYEKAIECFDKAIEQDPNYAVAYTNRGIAYYYLSQYERAIADYEKAIELNPNYAVAYSNRGCAYYGLSQYERAIADYDKAIELDPNYAVAYDHREIALRKLKQEQMTAQTPTMATQTPTPISASPVLPISPNYLYIIPIALFIILLPFIFYIRGKREKSVKTIEKPQPPTEPPKPETEPVKEEPIIKKEMPPPISEPITIERAIYDPCKRDFIERALPRMKEWINRHDPGAYWFAISIQNSTDRAIEEWGVELEFSSALKIKEAKIEGIEIEIPSESRLGLFKISVPKEYGIVIPKGGAQRVYFKLRADKPKTTYEISGVFKSATSGDVLIRAKEFKYLCDTGVSPEAVKTELKKTFSEKDAARLALSFKTVQELDRMCDQEAKTEEYQDKLSSLKGYTEGFSSEFT
ncbi:hypothetical protein C5S30_05055, partial [ANME-1 cluster archaeon GoMg4]|nr:hypothetical protein [ANME-1 cluster archaeon GoMg4]